MLKLNDFVLFILISFSGIYYNEWLIKPSYVSLLITAFIIVLFSFNGVKFKFSLSIFILIFIASMATLATQTALSGELSTTIFYTYIIIIPFLVTIFERVTAKKTILSISFFIVVLFYILETYIRITHPDYSHLPKGDYVDSITSTFYIYKINSIAFEDSNFVSVVLIVFYITLRCTVIFSNIKFKFYNVYLYCLLVLIVLTFSRSAYIGVVAFEIIRRVFYSQRGNQTIRNFLIFCICILIVPLSIQLLGHLTSIDASFLSKFHILDLTIKYLGRADIWHILFGIGFGNAINAIGMGAHNIFVALLIENGILGVLLYFSILLSISLRYKLTILLIFPVTLMGLSFSQIAMPYYYVAISWLIYLNENYYDKSRKHSDAYIQ
ncbi:hypothetical protein [Citrobacter gillenii]|uniref:hypothetical protein n=1 Tax=Citrobacter gillenii TaxID=67828 RepID=UPI00398763D5